MSMPSRRPEISVTCHPEIHEVGGVHAVIELAEGESATAGKVTFTRGANTCTVVRIFMGVAGPGGGL